MASTLDVAKYITERTGEVSAMKLQKLMYYAQAWNLVWDESPLFSEDFQAWANGPVLPSLYQKHRGLFKVSASLFADADSTALTEAERDNIERVLAFYGDKTAQWLSNLTHQEDPWKLARGDAPIGAPSTSVISQGAMHEYYSAL
ncbi:hypothetical protein CS062_09710 [Roseateles chitinivorans]|jgi:uncharacterized phage-associated protein|uniref:Antitoxin SocA-like Panacea domain-containing protein n=1 Tax=Roseateles chitinivorans TaxID=2917965 RepID=A0A2G9CAQ5_9BURK|nr:Panacea domain-containing protein [Roseateles chitinivorans]PIM53432.1 hypothetical protein CS062_09710 [Roseateles chitinivorans]